jgi:hypothetical protein
MVAADPNATPGEIDMISVCEECKRAPAQKRIQDHQLRTQSGCRSRRAMSNRVVGWLTKCATSSKPAGQLMIAEIH